MKFLISLLLLGIISMPVTAQVKKTIAPPKVGKDWLLWYKGKKLNDSVLLANNGWKILYKRTAHTVEIKTGTQTSKFQKIETELNNTATRRIDMIRRIAGDKPDPSDLPTIRLVMAAIDDIDSQYRSALKASIELPADALQFEETITKHSGPSADVQMAAKTWQEMCADINAEIKSLRDPAAIDLGTPPDYDVSICFSCDSLAKKRMFKKRDDYAFTLVKDEQRIAQHIFKVFKAFDAIEQKNGGNRTEEVKEATEILLEQFKQLNERVIKKLKILFAQFPHDFLKTVNLVPLALGIDRQLQLLGMGTLTEDLMIGKIMNAADVNLYLKKLIAEEDYDRVLNITWMLSTERQFQLMGEASFMNEGEFQKVLDFNRFKLTVSADAKEEGDKYFKKGQAKSEATYYKAIPAKDCKYSFIQSNGNKIMGVGNAFLNFNLLQAESSAGIYTGTKKWVMIDPYIKFGFCGDDDTARLFVIMPHLQEPFETWQTDIGPQHFPEISGLFSDGFENNDNMVDESDDMLEKMQTIQKFTAGLSTAEEIVMDPMGLNKGYAIVETIKENFSKNALTLVPITAKNKSTVLFDQLYKGKLYSKNEHITYANLWIKLEHVKD